MKTFTTCNFHQFAVDTFLSGKIACVGHSNSPVKSVTRTLPAPSSRGENNKPVSLTVQFVNYKASF